jgi:hypothetical protein
MGLRPAGAEDDLVMSTCHGPDADIRLTFSFHHVDPPRPVRLLGTADSERARSMASQKKRVRISGR